MTDSPYVDELKLRLKTMENDIAKARKQFEAAESATKAAALEALTEMEIRHRELVGKIEELTRAQVETWSAAHRKFRKDADGLADAFEKWFMKYT